jgi:hypothetical protein
MDFKMIRNLLHGVLHMFLITFFKNPSVMKLRIFILAFALLSVTFLQAQIKEQSVRMSQGNNNALVLEIPNVKEKMANDLWKEYLKDFYKAKPKWNRKTSEWFSDDADIKAIGLGNTVDIYTTIVEKGEDVTVNLWIDLGGAYLSSEQHKDRYKEAEKMLMRFGLEVAREKVKLELDAEKDALKELTKEMERLKTANDRYHKEIERAQAAIKQAEKDIENNVKEQKDMEQSIAEQEKAIKAVEKRLNDL